MRRLFSLLLVLFAFDATADDYYWGLRGTGPFFPNPTSACETLNGQPWGQYVGQYLELTSTVPTDNPELFNCIGKFHKSWGTPDTGLIGIATRYGSQCPVDTTYNPQAGSCDSDPCKSSIGQTIGSRVTMGVIAATGNTISHNDPPGSVCQGQCQYAWNGSHASNIYRFIEGVDNSIYGDYLYVGNGVSCSATDTPPAPQPITATSPVRNKDASCTGSVVDPQGGGVSSQCTATDEYRDPGALSCGQMNGQWLCTVGNPSPKAAKKTVTVDTNTVTNPDGSKTTTKSTVTVVKDCSGLKGCRDTTTGKIETTGTNADGSPGSSTTTGSCSGPGCGTGSGTGDSDGEGEGDGLSEEELAGTCDPATDPNQCGNKSAAGLDCSVALACSGDAIQCAMLQEQKTQRCNSIYDNSVAGTINAQVVADPSFTVSETEVDASGLFNDGMNAARWLPSSCPGDKSFSAMGFSYTLSMDPVCTAATTLSNIVVGLSMLFFALYIGRSTGGE